MLFQHQSYSVLVDHDEEDSETLELKNLNTIQVASEKGDTHDIKDIQTDRPICSCYDYSSNQLPCRHVFFIRNELGKPVFEETMLNECFKVDYYVSYINAELIRNKIATVENANTLNSIDKSKIHQMDSKDRYNLCWRPMQELANYLSNLSGDSFEEKFSLFLLMKDYFEKNVRIFFSLFFQIIVFYHRISFR